MSTMKERNCKDLSELPLLAAELLSRYPDQRIFAFFGAMGAGKTTFIQHLCSHLGVIDPVNSPTFALINEYRNVDGNPVYHFDFYRIKNITEVMDIGYENYFYSGHYCFIEWPEKVIELLPENCVYVKIEEDGTESGRVFRF